MSCSLNIVFKGNSEYLFCIGQVVSHIYIVYTDFTCEKGLCCDHTWLELDVTLACEVMGSEPIPVSTLYILIIYHMIIMLTVLNTAMQCNAIKPSYSGAKSGLTFTEQIPH